MNKLRVILSGLLAFIYAMVIVIVVMALYYTHSNPVTFCLIWIGTIVLNAIFAFMVFNSERQVNIKLCWILVITMLPLLGILIYLIFGTCPYDKKTWKMSKEYMKHYNYYEDFSFSKELNLHDIEIEQIFKYNLNLLSNPIYQKNSVRVIKDLINLYSEFVNLVRSAKKTIHLSTYILKDGVFFRTLAVELAKKCQEGVEVKLMYDWVGCYGRLPKHLINQLKQYGVKVAIFNPKGINMFKSVTNYRSHRKSIIVDNKYAIFGGSNIADEYLSISPVTSYWRDQNFFVEGEIVNSINILFLYDWFNFSDHAKKKFEQDNRKFLNSISKILQIEKADKNQVIQLVQSAPDYEEKQIQQTLINLIRKAKKSIKIVTPYLFPTQDIIESLSAVALSGVKVELILPGANDDKSFVLTTNRFHYKKLLSSGCKIYEYAGFIHSKYFIMDDCLVFTGSNNLDYRSLWINFESSLLIYDDEFGKRMNDVYAFDKRNSNEIKLNDLTKFYTLWNKIRFAFVNVFHPLV